MTKPTSALVLFMLFLITTGITFKLPAQPSGFGARAACKGYVVFSIGDTLGGTIKWRPRYVENNPAEIKFTTRDGSTDNYKAGEIHGFGIYPLEEYEALGTIKEGILENYVSLPSIKKGVPVFMNRLIDGRITVYQNMSSFQISSSTIEQNSKMDGISFSYSPGEGLTIGPSYTTTYRVIESHTRFTSYLVSKNSGSLIKVEKENYENLFQNLFGDCPGIEQELKKNPDLVKFKAFMILVEIYNQTCK